MHFAKSYDNNVINYWVLSDISFNLSSRLDLKRQSVMPLHKYAPKMWDALKMKQGIYARLPKHYVKSLEQKDPTPVHWRPLGVQYRANPKTGQKERVQDVPIPIYYPPHSQDGLWAGEGWISGFRYANNDKVSLQEDDFLPLVLLQCVGMTLLRHNAHSICF